MNASYEKKRYPLEYLRIKTLSPKPHMHSETETVICIRGKCNAYIDGKCYSIGDGEAITVFPHCRHFYDVTEEGDFALLVYYSDIVPNVKDILSSSVPSKPETPFSERLSAELEELTALYVKNDRRSQMLLTAFINRMLYEFIPEFCLVGISDDRTLTEKIMKYCASKFTEEITLGEIAEHFGRSKSSISHIFGNVAGFGIPHYINWLRISFACRLLATTDLTVTAIASEVGFGTLRNFNRVFTEMMGQTPSLYRGTSNLKNAE